MHGITIYIDEIIICTAQHRTYVYSFLWGAKYTADGYCCNNVDNAGWVGMHVSLYRWDEIEHIARIVDSDNYDARKLLLTCIANNGTNIYNISLECKYHLNLYTLLLPFFFFF